ncbi:MAG: BON domain-containing protein [Pseudodesulfovibrio sp.]|uniref:Transport-associated protein n=1 Tax=Pseudodesulfovibrio aespoeensis (strain ATCC 700646 / DSM 10631 / Aspo-2) TaxID=643562 RepID=E6VYS1_PSEA9|nr:MULTISPECIES: BON domain-containing protein [Pseudodesulfovibrio]MBU4192114.1 BON domain-containing protein [Pseudomonadota bacterium]ADU63938.1 transport-associated protein [Pseudodesulfovibrio aespoeensis Aspo-2]MBU4243131.1 BON domain-containing protein [Pseudomonadota bacterium]MBU4379931.1 BON domain-containing protein [Pseudomonadota bacterium]MBU4474392.1 BON domain-containing protein [Pseudomonadota bacterium]
MRRTASFFAILGLLAVLALSAGCTVYDVAVEERDLGDWTSDKNISYAIEREYLRDDLVKYMDFDAFSYEGHVFIVGEYESRDQIDRAVSIAKGVKGVRKVTTHLIPKRANDDCNTADNLELYTIVKQRLVTDTQVWSTNIDIKTMQCNIILLGIVGSATERDSAIAHARSVEGARSVESFLIVK